MRAHRQAQGERNWVGCLIVAIVMGLAPGRVPAQDAASSPLDHDPVARLQERLDSGVVRLEHEGGRGYLAAVLQALEVPAESQGLVFSRTSFQRNRIGPATPRAVYFGDDVYVGYVPGSDVLELAAVDPREGAVFYVLDQAKGSTPRFQRQTHECLSCHESGRTQDVPGFLVRSVFPDAKGNPLFQAGDFTTDATSPLEERWGGWYVTGTHGRSRPMSNAVVADATHPNDLHREAGANRTSLADRIDSSPYLSPHSDLVALMVLEHQTQMHNALTWAATEVRKALAYQEGVNQAFGEPAGHTLDSTRRRIDNAADRVLRHLLFSGEAALVDSVEGTSGFAHAFAERGHRDPEGRSLREFDLRTRLFRYPCSYLVESAAFDALPEVLLARISEKLDAILSGRDQSAAYSHLAPADRQAIRAMLKFLKPSLTTGWS